MGEFSKLENVDVKGFRELGKYHQARVAQAKGDKAKAIELLKDVQKQVSEPTESHPFPYLEFVVEDRLRELDPTALPPKAPKGMPGMTGPGGAAGMDNPQVQQLLEQLRKQGKMPAGLGGGAPPPPAGGGGPAPGSPQ
jgi:hypothetical protein